MEKKEKKPLRNTYVFEIDIKEVLHGTVSCVEIIERTYFVDEIGAERLLISSYAYGTNARIDAELDAYREDLDDLLAAARECDTRATRVGMHKIILEDIRVRDGLITSYLRGFERLRHFRVKMNHTA